MADSVTFTTTIANGATKTSAVNISDFFITGVEVPDSMTGTSLTFELGDASGTTVQLRDEENAAISLTITTTAAVYPLDARYTAAANFMKVVSGSAETGAKTIKLHGYRI